MAAEGGGGDLEWEDAADDWEVLIDEDDDVAGESSEYAAISIEVDHPAGGGGKGKRVPVSKEIRQHCRALHQLHLLCLLVCVAECDRAADDEELQAQVLSLLPDKRLLLDTSHEAGRMMHTLSVLLAHFRETFSLSSPDSSTDNPPPVCARAKAALQARAGPPELLVLLFVALVRAQGVPSRTVRLLQPLPKEPWRTPARELRTLSPQAARAREVSLMRKRKAQQQAPDEAGVGEAARGDDTAQATAQLQNAGSIVRGPAAKAAVTAGGCSKCKSPVASRQGGAPLETPKAAGTKPRGRQPRAGGNLAATHDGPGGPQPPSFGTPAGTWDPGAQAGGGNGGNGGDGGSNGSDGTGHGAARRTRGEEEFERELQLAMMATAAEAEARERASGGGAAATAAAEDPQPSRPGSKARNELLRMGRRASKANLSSKDVWASALSPVPGVASSSKAGLAPEVWAEVYCGSADAGRWVHVDVINGLVNKPGSVAEATERRQPVAYIVACMPGLPGTLREAGGGCLQCRSVKDVTHRYVASKLNLHKWRDNEWWQALMGRVGIDVGSSGAGRPAAHGSHAGTSAAAAGPNGGAAAERSRPAGTSGAGAERPGHSRLSDVAMRARREDAELRQRVAAAMSNLPTSIDGFKNHPVYVLKRHISKYEAIQPGAELLGTHRGEAIYSREAVSGLHTADRWRREGREVCQDELEKPYKLVKKRAAAKPPGASQRFGARRASVSGRGDDSNEDADEPASSEQLDGSSAAAGSAPSMNKLYGRWQTEPWRRPVALNGVVPKNARGNVECPPLLKELPLGTVHLSFPGIWAVCRDLRIDYAPALVGFELQQGRMLPKIDGVVVCEEFQEQVVCEYLQREEAKHAARMAKQRREALAAWRQVLQAMRMRQQLRSNYEADGKVALAEEQDVVDLTRAEDGEDTPASASAHEMILQRLQRKYGQAHGGQLEPEATAPDSTAAVNDSMERIDAEEF